uniref:Uncharacterized protein n=1 Tax=Anopheles melas TaxID=34690 RepID=A0A182TWQ9_9DIPT
MFDLVMAGRFYLLTEAFRVSSGSRGQVQLLLRHGVAGQRGNMDGTTGGSDRGSSRDDTGMVSDRSKRGMGSGQQSGVRGSIGSDGRWVGSSMGVRVASVGVRVGGMSVRPGSSVGLHDGGTVSGVRVSSVRVSGVRVSSLGGDGQGDDGNGGNDALLKTGKRGNLLKPILAILAGESCQMQRHWNTAYLHGGW